MLYYVMDCLLNFTIGNSYNQEAHGLFSSLVSWSVLDNKVIFVCWLQGYRCSSISGVLLLFLKNTILTEVSAIFEIQLYRKIGFIKCFCSIASSIFC